MRPVQITCLHSVSTHVSILLYRHTLHEYTNTFSMNIIILYYVSTYIIKWVRVQIYERSILYPQMQTSTDYNNRRYIL